jgi:hypothetical protein
VIYPSIKEFHAILRENIRFSLIPAFYDCTLVWDETLIPTDEPGVWRVQSNGGCFVTHNGERRGFHGDQCKPDTITEWLDERSAWRDPDGSWAKMITEASK